MHVYVFLRYLGVLENKNLRLSNKTEHLHHNIKPLWLLVNGYLSMTKYDITLESRCCTSMRHFMTLHECIRMHGFIRWYAQRDPRVDRVCGWKRVRYNNPALSAHYLPPFYLFSSFHPSFRHPSHKPFYLETLVLQPSNAQKNLHHKNCTAAIRSRLLNCVCF